ncbi:hypothetical protein Ddye_024636 [Dipteronia dyeriana]|uniref:Uncharacterized protein n=1 Tax=Dipteronia dyeriana TaxID=168575 RepID=A0AAD9WUD5_9ROSI|nr:hypothetical protein Ddye_024636 [Dipteronia dyeriana]
MSYVNLYSMLVKLMVERPCRVNVSIDLQADNTEAQDGIEDENADEYGYVTEFEKGTAQALGPATAEQIDTVKWQ